MKEKEYRAFVKKVIKESFEKEGDSNDEEGASEEAQLRRSISDAYANQIREKLKSVPDYAPLTFDQNVIEEKNEYYNTEYWEEELNCATQAWGGGMDLEAFSTDGTRSAKLRFETAGPDCIFVGLISGDPVFSIDEHGNPVQLARVNNRNWRLSKNKLPIDETLAETAIMDGIMMSLGFGTVPPSE